MSSCVFCDIVEGSAPASVVYQDDVAVAFMSIGPVNPGHLMVVPRRHASALADLDETTGAHLFRVTMRMAGAIRRSGVRCEGINLFLADGEAAFQEIPHVHMHVFPRFKQAGQMVSLVDTLFRQHQAGRRVTDLVLRLAQGRQKTADDHRQLVDRLSRRAERRVAPL